MKHQHNLWTVTVFFISFSCFCFALPGSGTEIDPYVIDSRADFDEYCGNSSYWGAGVHTRLDEDIDLTGTVYTNSPIAYNINERDTYSFGGTPFRGHFNGNGHRIIGLTIQFNRHYQGLFGIIESGGVVEKLGVEDIHLTRSCSSSPRPCSIGGICGSNRYGTIRQCYTSGTIDLFGVWVGGICGDNNGMIENCYSRVTIFASNYWGGICGSLYINGTIRHCYSAGIICNTGLFLYGGLVGHVQHLYENSGTVEASFWDVESSFVTTSAGGEGFTTDEMREPSLFTNAGWDVGGGTAVWRMSHASGFGNGYPVLAWQADDTDTSLAGNGTQTHPFLISSRADFDAFCANPYYWDDHISLESNIDLAGTTYAMAPIAPDLDPTITGQFSVQFDGTPFTGYFNGNGRTISGLTIDGGDNTYLGLFGSIQRGRVENLTVAGCSISGNAQYIGGLTGGSHMALLQNITVTGSILGNPNSSTMVGGFIGRLMGGTKTVPYTSDHVVRNCHTDVIVTAQSKAGGFAGEISYARPVIDCSSKGTLTTNGSAGGFCGYNSGSSDRISIQDSYSEVDVEGHGAVGGFVGFTSITIITRCYATGSVSGQSFRVGGFCGANQGTITDSYCTGDVSGAHFETGGFCGENWNGSMKRCYATGSVTIVGQQDVAGFSARTHFVVVSPDVMVDCFWNTETSGTPYGFFRYIESQYVPQTSYPGVCVGLDISQMRQQSYFTDAGWDFIGETANGEDDIWQMPSSSSVNNGFPILAPRPDAPLAGSGTDVDPYIIDSRSKFNAYVNDPLYWNAHVRLECDLDLSDTVYAAAPIAPSLSLNEEEFVGVTFSGTFNGNRHRITGLRIEGTNASFIGLFGFIDWGGKVHDLDVRVNNTGSYYVGGLCGFNSGIIENCSAGGIIFGSEIAGGLCGYNRNSIATSYSHCTIDGYEYIGGFVGHNYYYGGVISNCYAAGKSLSGGNCFGFVAVNGGVVQNCYAAITPPDGGQLYGAFCGAQEFGSEDYFDISGCYYDNTTGIEDFATGLTPAQMKTKSMFDGWKIRGIVPSKKDIWRMPFYTNQGRPVLLWQIDLLDIINHWLEDDRYCDLNNDQIVNYEDFAIHILD